MVVDACRRRALADRAYLTPRRGSRPLVQDSTTQGTTVMGTEARLTLQCGNCRVGLELLRPANH